MGTRDDDAKTKFVVFEGNVFLTSGVMAAKQTVKLSFDLPQNPFN